MNKVEEVARALCRKTYEEVKGQPGFEEINLESAVDEDWRGYIDRAKAAIEALMEPNKAMHEAGVIAKNSDELTPVWSIWQAMLKAALNPTAIGDE